MPIALACMFLILYVLMYKKVMEDEAGFTPWLVGTFVMVPFFAAIVQAGMLCALALFVWFGQELGIYHVFSFTQP